MLAQEEQVGIRFRTLSLYYHDDDDTDVSDAIPGYGFVRVAMDYSFFK